MRSIGEDLTAYGRIARLSFRQAYSTMAPLSYILFLLVRPISQVLFWGLAARFATGNTDVTFQLVGNAVQVCALSGLFTTGEMLMLERRGGTLSLVTLTTRNKFLVFSGRALVIGMHGLVTTVVALAAGIAVFGMDLSHVNIWGLALALTITVLSTSCLGVALGSIGLILTDINLVGNILAVALMVICGIQFPVSQLPKWLQLIAYSFPMTRGADAARLAVAGVDSTFWSLLAGELVVGMIWLAAGHFLYRYLEYRARVRGTLDLY